MPSQQDGKVFEDMKDCELVAKPIMVETRHYYMIIILISELCRYMFHYLLFKWLIVMIMMLIIIPFMCFSSINFVISSKVCWIVKCFRLLFHQSFQSYCSSKLQYKWNKIIKIMILKMMNLVAFSKWVKWS